MRRQTRRAGGGAATSAVGEHRRAGPGVGEGLGEECGEVTRSRGEKKGSEVGKRENRHFRGTEGQMVGAGGGLSLPHVVCWFCCEQRVCVGAGSRVRRGLV